MDIVAESHGIIAKIRTFCTDNHVMVSSTVHVPISPVVIEGAIFSGPGSRIQWSRLLPCETAPPAFVFIDLYLPSGGSRLAEWPTAPAGSACPAGTLGTACPQCARQEYLMPVCPTQMLQTHYLLRRRPHSFCTTCVLFVLASTLLRGHLRLCDVLSLLKLHLLVSGMAHFML